MQKIKHTVAGTFALVATVLTVAVATPLRAETVGVPVAYGDLDIRSEAGAARLDHRIRRAAHQICGTADVATSIVVANCRRDVIDGARARLAAVQPVEDVKLAAR